MSGRREIADLEKDFEVQNNIGTGLINKIGNTKGKNRCH